MSNSEAADRSTVNKAKLVSVVPSANVASAIESAGGGVHDHALTVADAGQVLAARPTPTTRHGRRGRHSPTGRPGHGPGRPYAATSVVAILTDWPTRVIGSDTPDVRAIGFEVMGRSMVTFLFAAMTILFARVGGVLLAKYGGRFAIAAPAAEDRGEEG